MRSSKRLTRWRTGLCATALFSVTFSPTVAMAQDVPQATTTSGLSIHHSFYDALSAEILAQNQGRTGVYGGSQYQPYVDEFTDDLDSIEDLLNQGWTAGLALITASFPTLGAILAGLEGIILLVCPGSQLFTLDIEVPSASLYSAFTVDDIQLNQTNTGQRFIVTLSDVGMIAVMELELSLAGCATLAEEDEDIGFRYPSATYQVDVTFPSAGGVQVDAQLLSALPPVEHVFSGSSNATSFLLWTEANIDIGGKDLEDHLDDFARIETPDQLENFFNNYWIDYLAKPGWQMNLDGTRQNTRYGENGVPGTVFSALYGPLTSDLNASKIRVEFDNVHSTVPANPLAACANPGFVAGPVVAPNFAAETPGSSAYHTSYKTFEHRIAAGIVSAVGHRSEDKPFSDFIVEHSMLDLVPEAGTLSVRKLFADPSSPVEPIPLTLQQQRKLLTTPVGTQKLLNKKLGELELKVEVCEVSRPTVAFPLGLGSSGTVQHDVVLTATIETATEVVLTEVFQAIFIGELRLSKHTAKNEIEFRTIHAELVSLVNGAGLASDEVDLTTAAVDAPVSLFLRAFVGDNTQPFPQVDQRVHYLIEGLVGPLVERAAHGMVVLPGLNFSPFNGFQLGYLAAAAQYHGSSYQLGFDFDRAKQCAHVLGWGQTPALVGGVPSLFESMLTVEVDWAEHVPQPGFYTETAVTAAVVAAPQTPDVTTNPSRFDTGYLSAAYGPSDGDNSRVMNASGYRVGDLIPGGGQHFVAATAVGYMSLRGAYPVLLFPETSIELRPYRQGPPPPCGQVFPGPVYEPPHQGSHHETGPYAPIYEAVTFETSKDCLGFGKCDGVRVVAMWTSPLFFDCPTSAFGMDERTFNTMEGTISMPPSTYEYELEVCIGNGGPGEVID